MSCQSPATPEKEKVDLASNTSTPIISRGGSNSEDLADERATSLLHLLRATHRIWTERATTPPSMSMLSQFLERLDRKYHALAESTMRDIPEMETFLQTVGKGRINEDEFGLVAEAVARRLAAGMNIPSSNKRYIRSSGKVMRHRAQEQHWMKGQEPTDRRKGLKPDFFTSRVQQDVATGEWHPVSLSTVLHNVGSSRVTAIPTTPLAHTTAESGRLRRSNRIASRLHKLSIGGGSSHSPSPPNPSVSTSTNTDFMWEDIEILWELKSSPDPINSSPVLANLTAKATEVLRTQWHRRFVLAFLVCGRDMKMVRFDRSGVLVSLSADICEDGGMLLVKCLLAGLVIPPPDVGLPRELEHPKTILVDEVPRLVVEVGGQEFVLGDQIVGPPRDHLVSRGTAVHQARRIGGNVWDACYKISWPHITRLHEGHILEELQGVEGVVKLFAWDVPKTEGMLDKTEIHRDFEAQTVSAKAISFLMAPANSSSSSSIKQQMTLEEETPIEFYPRQYRQVVTAYIPESFSPTLSALDLLSAWRSLYLVVNEIAQRGWVHRDLSWNNVRIIRHNSSDSHKDAYNSVSIILIDFDLASRIFDPNSNSPDRTGTIAFMPIQILLGDKVRHHELHEDEAVFWIGFLAFISRTNAGSAQVAGLSRPREPLKNIGFEKCGMVICQRKEWFVVGKEGDEFRRICIKVLMTQFAAEGKVSMDHPLMNEKDEVGRWKREALHKRVVQDVVRVLEEEIDNLLEIGEAEEDLTKNVERKLNL